MNKKYQIFLSSTYVDLKEERSAVFQCIVNMGHIPAGMEYFTGNNEEQFETIKKWIQESDIFILILGSRLGTKSSKHKLSYIELEYDFALSLNKEIYIFCLDKDYCNNKSNHNDETNRRDYKRFKEKILKNRLRRTNIKSCHELTLEVEKTILDHVTNNKSKFNGWLNLSTLNDTKVIDQKKQFKASIQSSIDGNSLIKEKMISQFHQINKLRSELYDLDILHNSMYASLKVENEHIPKLQAIKDGFLNAKKIYITSYSFTSLINFLEIELTNFLHSPDHQLFVLLYKPFCDNLYSKCILEFDENIPFNESIKNFSDIHSSEIMASYERLKNLGKHNNNVFVRFYNELPYINGFLFDDNSFVFSSYFLNLQKRGLRKPSICLDSVNQICNPDELVFVKNLIQIYTNWFKFTFHSALSFEDVIRDIVKDDIL